jgi:hypothetical protein
MQRRRRRWRATRPPRHRLGNWRIATRDCAMSASSCGSTTPDTTTTTILSPPMMPPSSGTTPGGGGGEEDDAGPIMECCVVLLEPILGVFVSNCIARDEERANKRRRSSKEEGRRRGPPDKSDNDGEEESDGEEIDEVPPQLTRVARFFPHRFSPMRRALLRPPPPSPPPGEGDGVGVDVELAARYRLRLARACRARGLLADAEYESLRASFKPRWWTACDACRRIPTSPRCGQIPPRGLSEWHPQGVSHVACSAVLRLAIRHSIHYLEGSHDPDMMSEVIARFKPFEHCCMAKLFVGGRGCFRGKFFDFLGKGVIPCVFFLTLCCCRNSSRCRRRRGGTSRYCTSRDGKLVLLLGLTQARARPSVSNLHDYLPRSSLFSHATIKRLWS